MFQPPFDTTKLVEECWDAVRYKQISSKLLLSFIKIFAIEKAGLLPLHIYNC